MNTLCTVTNEGTVVAMVENASSNIVTLENNDTITRLKSFLHFEYFYFYFFYLIKAKGEKRSHFKGLRTMAALSWRVIFGSILGKVMPISSLLWDKLGRIA